jgi:purine nucleosidase
MEERWIVAVKEKSLPGKAAVVLASDGRPYNQWIDRSTVHVSESPAPVSLPTEPRKLIIDCDPGIDDAVALAIALFDPRLEVVAVTAAAVCGSCPMVQCTPEP